MHSPTPGNPIDPERIVQPGSPTADRVTGAGLSPLPVQRPIPVWIGANSPRSYKRVGRIADGWFPMVAPGPALLTREGSPLCLNGDRLPFFPGLETALIVGRRQLQWQLAEERAQWRLVGLDDLEHCGGTAPVQVGDDGVPFAPLGFQSR